MPIKKKHVCASPLPSAQRAKEFVVCPKSTQESNSPKRPCFRRRAGRCPISPTEHFGSSKFLRFGRGELCTLPDQVVRKKNSGAVCVLVCMRRRRWRRGVSCRSRSQLSTAASRRARRPPLAPGRHARPGTSQAHPPAPHSCTLTPDTPITCTLF